METTKGPSTGSETTESPSTALYTTEGLSTESQTTRVSSTSEAVSTIAIVTSETPSTLVTTEGVSTSITGIRSTASITSQAPSQTLGTTEGLSTISTTSKAFSTVLPDTEVFSTEFSLTSGTSESPSTIPARTEVFSTALPVTTELLSKNVSSTFVITEEISTNRTSTEASLTTKEILLTTLQTTEGPVTISATTEALSTASPVATEDISTAASTTTFVTSEGPSAAETPSQFVTVEGIPITNVTTEVPSVVSLSTEGRVTAMETTEGPSTMSVTSTAYSSPSPQATEDLSTKVSTAKLVKTKGPSTALPVTSEAPSTLVTVEGLSTTNVTAEAPPIASLSTEHPLTTLETTEGPLTTSRTTRSFPEASTTVSMETTETSIFEMTEVFLTTDVTEDLPSTASLTKGPSMTSKTTDAPLATPKPTRGFPTTSPLGREDLSTEASTTTLLKSEGPSTTEGPSTFVTIEETALATTEGPSTMSVTSTAYSSPSQATEDLSTEVSTTKFVKSKGPSTALPVTSEAPSTLVTVEGLSTTNVTAEFRSIAPLSTERPLTTIETTEGPSSSGTTMAFSEGSTTVSLETTEASELETTEASEFETTEVFLTANVTKAPSTASLTKEGPATAFETTEGPLETPVPSRDISTALPMTTEALSTKASKTTVEKTIGSSTALPATTEVLSTVSILTTETPSTFVTTEEILTTYITEEVSPSASLTTEGLSTKLDTMPFTTEGFSTAPPVRTGAPSTYVTTDGLSTASLKVSLPTFETTEGLPLLYETTKSPIVSSVATKGPSSTLGTTEELSVELETSEGLSTASATTVTSSTIHVTTKGSSAASVTKEGSSTILFATETPSTADITTEAPSQTSISADVFSTRLKTTAGPSTTYVTTEADFSVPMTTEGLMTSDATTESPSTMLATTSASAPNDTRLPPGPIEQQPTVTTESKGITFHASTDIASPVRTEGDKKKITKTDSYPNTTATTMTAFAQFTTLDLNETDATQRSVTTLPPSVEDVTVITSMETEVQTEEPITSFSPIIQQTSKNITTIPDQEAVTPSLDTTTADILETGFGTSSTVTSKQGTTIGYKTRSFPKVTDEVTGTSVFTTEGITSGVSDTTEDATTQYQTSGPSLSTRWTGTRAMINITKEDSDISLTSPEDFYTTQPTTFISEESSGEPTTQETIYTTSAKQDEEVTSSVTSPTYQITTEHVTLETGSGTTEETPSSVLYTVRTTSNLSTIETSSSPEVTLEMFTSTLGEVTDAVTGTTALTSEGTTAAFSPATEEVTVLYQTSVPILSTIKAVDISETVSDEMYTTDMPFTSPATLQETTIEYKDITSPEVTSRVPPTTFPQVTDEVTDTTALSPEGTPSGSEPQKIIGTTITTVDISETVSDEMYTTDMPFTSPATLQETTIEYKTVTSPKVTTKVLPTTFPRVTDEVTDTTALTPEGTPSGAEPPGIIGTTEKAVDISETVSDEMYTTDELMPFTSPATLQETTIEYRTSTSPKATSRVPPTTLQQVTDEFTGTTALTLEGTPSGAEPREMISTTVETVSDDMYTTDELMLFTSPATIQETTIEYKAITSPKITSRVPTTTFPQVTDAITDTTALTPEGTPSGSEPQKIIGTTIKVVDISVSDEMYTTDELMPFTLPTTLQETTIEYKTVTSPKVATRVFPTTFPQGTAEVTDTTALSPEGTPSGAEPPGIIATTVKAVDISETVSDEMYTTDELMPFTSPTTLQETTIEYKAITSPKVTGTVPLTSEGIPSGYSQATEEVTVFYQTSVPTLSSSGAEPPGIIGTTVKAVGISETVSDEMYTTGELMPFTSPTALHETTIEYKDITSPEVTSRVPPTTFPQVTDEVTDTTALTPEGTPSGAGPPGIIGTTVKAVDISETVSDEMYTTDELIEYKTLTSPQVTTRGFPTTFPQVTDEVTDTTLSPEGTPSGSEPQKIIGTTIMTMDISETVSDEMYTTDELMPFTSPTTLQETTIEYKAITSPNVTSRVPPTTFPQVTDEVTDTTTLTPEGTPSGDEPQKIIGTTIKAVDMTVFDEMYTTDELIYGSPTTLQETTIEYKTITTPTITSKVPPTTFPQVTDEVRDTTALTPEGTPSGAEPQKFIGTTIKAVDISETVSDEMYTTDELMPFTSPATLQETTIEYKTITSPKFTDTVPLTSEGIPSGFLPATEEVTVLYQTSVPTVSTSGAEPPGIIGTTVKAVDISETVSDEMYTTEELMPFTTLQESTTEYKAVTSPKVTSRVPPTTFPEVTDEVADATTLTPEGTPSGDEPQKIIGTTIKAVDMTVFDEMYTTDEVIYASPTTLQETTIEYKAITSPKVTSRVPPTTFPQVTDEVTDTTALSPEGTPSGSEPQKIIGTTIKAVDISEKVSDDMYTTGELMPFTSPTALQETTIKYKDITSPEVTSRVPPTTFPQVTDEVTDTTALTPEGTPSGAGPPGIIGTTVKAVDISETVSDEMYTTDELIEYTTLTSPQVTTRGFPTTFPQVTDEVTDTTLSPEGTPSGSEPQKIIGTTITTMDISEIVSDEMYTTDELMPFTSPTTLQETTIEYKAITSPNVTSRVPPTTFPQVTDEVTDTTTLTPEGTPSGDEPQKIIGTTVKAVEISETVSDEMYTTDELMPFTSPATLQETTIEYKTITSPKFTDTVPLTSEGIPSGFSPATEEVTVLYQTSVPTVSTSGAEPPGIIGTTVKAVDISETVSDEMYTTEELMPFTTLQESTTEYKAVTSPKVTSRVPPTTFPEVTDEVAGHFGKCSRGHS